MFGGTKTSTRRLLLNNKFISKAEKHSSSSSWWNNFFFQDDGNWFGLKEDDMLEMEVEKGETELSEENKFEAWKQRAEAIIELREAQQDNMNQDSRKWEDWLLLDSGSDSDSDSDSWMKDYYNDNKVPPDYDYRDEERGLVKSIRSFIYGGQQQDEDMLYEDRVFQYASSNSAKFLAVLIIIPWALDFLVHDYILMPFLDRYVKTVPLAAQVLDVRRYQKLQIVEELRTERKRFEFEVEIGKSPPLSDDDIWWELRHKA
ncbi:hypothetical protein TanjilG_01283 [Lupinus angustifolius]|uniref:Uncharacterized protein n=2 Tax=Lupinus angustifolius TaxID=3871 RepID=A0A4P1REB4_LUPAN|nr:hypothetical protein TanjilG_01283 [Lupinus angustifolius]